MLLQTADSLAHCAKVGFRSTELKTSQILHLSRLLLLFEYLIHNLYEAPRDLIQHVTHNIFRRFRSYSSSSSGTGGATSVSSHPLHSPPKYFLCKDLESVVALRSIKCPVEFQHSFYNLHNPPELPTVQQEVPKLDGLALSFLLGATEIIYYRQIYDALVTLLQVLHQADLKRECDNPISAMAATHYCFAVSWRVLQSLPPSVEFLQELIASQGEGRSGGDPSLPACSVLHSLVLVPRTAHKYVHCAKMTVVKTVWIVIF